MPVAMGFWGYWLRIWRTAFAAAWRTMSEHSAATLVRDAFITALAVGSLLVLQPALLTANLLGAGSVTEWAVWSAAFLAALVVTFGAVLIFHGLLWQPFALWRLEQASAEALRAEKAAREALPRPDWPLEDLLRHVRSLYAGYPDDADFFQAAEDVRDACALGEIKIWGRRSKVIGTSLTQKEYLAVGGIEEIEPAYWRTHEIYSPSFEADDGSGRTEPTSHGDDHIRLLNDSAIIYQQMRIDKAQALLKWPQK